MRRNWVVFPSSNFWGIFSNHPPSTRNDTRSSLCFKNRFEQFDGSSRADTSGGNLKVVQMNHSQYIQADAANPHVISWLELFELSTNNARCGSHMLFIFIPSALGVFCRAIVRHLRAVCFYFTIE